MIMVGFTHTHAHFIGRNVEKAAWLLCVPGSCTGTLASTSFENTYLSILNAGEMTEGARHAPTKYVHMRLL